MKVKLIGFQGREIKKIEKVESVSMGDKGLTLYFHDNSQEHYDYGENGLTVANVLEETSLSGIIACIETLIKDEERFINQVGAGSGLGMQSTGIIIGYQKVIELIEFLKGE